MKRLIVATAVVVVVVMMHGWQASADGISPLVSCTPDCSGVTDGDKVPNPFNCTEYYYCIGGEPAPHPTPCPEGNEFVATTGECGPAGSEPCEAICGTGSGCQLTCNASFSVVADVFDCSHYYFCNPDGTTDGYCTAERPHFDGSTCVNDESVCCSGYCDPYCDGTGFSLVPDPNDCTKFYACDTVEGTPGEGVHFECDPGQYFNIQMGYCMAGVPDPCPTLCQDVGGGSTTTTSTTTTTASGGGSTTTTISSGGDCVTSLTCPADGFFPACQTCQPEYFSCSAAGAAGVLLTCPDGDVFNTNPEYPMCVLVNNCPYP